MSAETATPAELPKSAWQLWREGIKEPTPSAYGTGTVSDIGLMYKLGKETKYLWQSSTDNLDKMQLELNDRGVRNVHRCYRFQVEGKFPSNSMVVNAVATQKQGWPARLAMGERATLFAWNDGVFTNVAFKKME
jgi:hypothetical protein